MSYENSKIAVDAAIFTIHDNKLKVYLSNREKDPFRGLLELPGGFLKESEFAEQTLQRKLHDLLGSSNLFCQQFFTFTDPIRDPRGRVVSIGFIALISPDHIKDTKNWHTINELQKIAFDHKTILTKARDFLRREINSLIVKQFLPEHFPLNRLQDAYEIIEDKKYDNRNFRRKMINSGLIEETKMMQEEVSHRPARLYKFKK